MGSLIHEITHQIEYQSNIADTLVRIAYKKGKKESGISEFLGGNWYYLLREAIICSISTRKMVSYFGEIIATKEEIERDTLSIEDLRKQNKNLPLYVQYVAQKIKPMLLDYLNKGKVIDEEFYNLVIHTWIDLIKEMKK